MKVATAYKFGVSSGSIFNFDRRNKGSDVEMKVGSIECKIVIGAIEIGSIQDGSVCRVDMIDRGGCVEGVSMSFVRAISRGARITPAILAAATATARDAIGDGDDKMSMPPAELVT